MNAAETDCRDDARVLFFRLADDGDVELIDPVLTEGAWKRRRPLRRPILAALNKRPAQRVRRVR